MQDLLIDLGWKSALIACAVLVGCQMLRGRAAGERVLLLRLGIGALLALPLVALLAPSLELAVLPAEEAVAMGAPLAGEGAEAAVEPIAAGTLDMVLMLYCAGAASVLLRLGIGLVTLLRWTRAARPVTDPHWTGTLARTASGIARPVRLMVSPDVRAPLSWGVAPAWILIGPEHEQRKAQAEAVLAHEVAHVRRFDWPMLMLAQLATALLWFNPFVWWLGRTLAAQIELAADEAAIGQVARLDYAQALLAVGAGSAPRSACGMTYARSTLGRRIRDVLEAAPHRSASRALCAAMLTAMIFAAGPLAALKLVPAEAQAALEPAIGNYLPAIIPEARAEPAPQRRVEAPKPAPQRRRKKPAGANAKPLPMAVAPTPPAPRPPLVKPPVPPAPGMLARREANKATRQANNEARKAARASAMAAKPRFSLRDRGRSMGMAEAANGMRAKARSFEAIAADPAMPRETRNEYVQMASRLRREAQKIDNEARQLIKP